MNSTDTVFLSWTPIARQEQGRGGDHQWLELDDAPFSLRDAHKLRDMGMLLQSQKKIDGVWHVVIMSPTKPLGQSDKEFLKQGSGKRQRMLKIR